MAKVSREGNRTKVKNPPYLLLNEHNEFSLISADEASATVLVPVSIAPDGGFF